MKIVTIPVAGRFAAVHVILILTTLFNDVLTIFFDVLHYVDDASADDANVDSGGVLMKMMQGVVWSIVGMTKCAIRTRSISSVILRSIFWESNFA